MVKPTLGDLLAQKSALDKQIAEFQKEQRADAIAQVKALMTEYGLTMSDIGGGKSSAAAKVKLPGAKVAAKYRNPATGETWSGRGLKPKWLTAALAAGRTLTDFAL